MVRNRWNSAEAKTALMEAGNDSADQKLALRVYSSRLIGQDPDLVMHGGGKHIVQSATP